MKMNVMPIDGKDTDGDIIFRDDPVKQGEPETNVVDRNQAKKPNMYNVIMYNDDFTEQMFVIALLVKVFNHDPTTASAIMLEIHNKGRGIAGTYTLEVAEMKVNECMTSARMAGFPLMVVAEKE